MKPLKMATLGTKTILALTTAVFLATLSPSLSKAAECRVKLEDVGTIIGKGSNKNLAFEDAATQCFERRERKLRSRRAASISSAGLDEETGLTLIDLCANVRCI